MDSLDKKLMGFHQISSEKLQHIFSALPGKCDLIIDPDLIKPMEIFCGLAFLRSRGVNKIYKFDRNQISVASLGHLVYFIRGCRLDTFKKVLEQIQSLRSRKSSPYSESTVHFHVIILPNVDCKHKLLLEAEGMHGIVQLYRFNWDFLTLDTNVVSLELPEVFKQVFVEKDFTLLPSIAKTFRIFNMITRKPNFVITYGSKCEKMWQMVEHLEQQRPSRNDERNDSDFSGLILLDRDKDFVSNFMTGVTYTALLTELYESNAGNLLADQPNRLQKGKLTWLDGDPSESEPLNNKSAKSQQPAGSILKMNSSIDKTFADNKYRHFSEVLTVLSLQAKALGLEGQEYSKDMKIHEMKQFVEQKLPKVALAKRELVKHLNLCEAIVNEFGKHFEMIQRVEENMAFNHDRKQTLQEIEEVFLTVNANRFVALKLLVLAHLTFELTEDEMVSSFRNYFNTFGFENLSVVVKLIEVSLLPNSVLAVSGPATAVQLQQQKLKAKILGTLPKLQPSFQTSAKKMKQIPVEETKEAEATPANSCPSYVFNRNYIPMVAQLLNFLCSSQSFEEWHSKIGHLEDMKISSKLSPDHTEPMTISAMNELIKAKRFPELLPFKPKTLMVFILGGITYSEIAAIDRISKLTGCKIITSSNAVVSGYDVLADLID